MNFEQAIRYKVENEYTDYGIEERHGNYRIYISEQGKKTNIGTYEQYREAKKALADHMIDRFIFSVASYDLDPYEGRLCLNSYIIFPTGEVFNLLGRKMAVSKNAYGHDIIKLNHRTYYVDTIYNNIFSGSKKTSH